MDEAHKKAQYKSEHERMLEELGIKELLASREETEEERRAREEAKRAKEKRSREEAAEREEEARKRAVEEISLDQ